MGEMIAKCLIKPLRIDETAKSSEVCSSSEHAQSEDPIICWLSELL